MPSTKDNAVAAKELLGDLKYVNETRFRECDQERLYQKMGKVVKQFLQGDVKFPREDPQHWSGLRWGDVQAAAEVKIHCAGPIDTNLIEAVEVEDLRGTFSTVDQRQMVRGERRVTDIGLQATVAKCRALLRRDNEERWPSDEGGWPVSASAQDSGGERMGVKWSRSVDRDARYLMRYFSIP